MKGLPSGYNKDLQEDKEAVFDAEDTLGGLPGRRAVGRRRADAQSRARGGGGVGLAAGDRRRRLPGRAAACRSGGRTKSSARWCGSCVAEGREFESLTLEEWRAASELFDADVVGRVTPRGVGGGQADAAVDRAGGGRAPRWRRSTRLAGWTALLPRETSSAKIDAAFRTSFPASEVPSGDFDAAAPASAW